MIDMGALFMPKGSIKGLVVLAILLPLPFFVIKGITIQEFYQSVVMALIGYLFGSESNAGTNKDKEVDDLKGDLNKLQIATLELQKAQNREPVIVPTDQA